MISVKVTLKNGVIIEYDDVMFVEFEEPNDLYIEFNGDFKCSSESDMSISLPEDGSHQIVGEVKEFHVCI